MSFSVEAAGTATVVKVAENITFVNQKEFLAIWETLSEESCRTAVLDLSAITYFGSMAVGLVTKVFTRMKDEGARIVAVRPKRDDVFQVFKITRLTDVIRFHDTLEAALEAVGVAPGTVATVVLESTDSVASKIDKLNEKDPEVRRYSAWALGLLGDTEAVPALEKLWSGDPDLKVREAAAESLERLTGRRYKVTG